MKKLATIIIFIIGVILFGDSEYGVFSDMCINGSSKGAGENEYIGEDIRWNVGYLGLQNGKEIGVAYRGVYNGINTGYISYIIELSNIKSGIGFMMPYIGKSGSISYDENGDSIGVFGYYEIEPMLYYGCKYNNIGIGIGIGTLIGNISGEYYIYPMGSLGIVYKQNNIEGGISVSDIGMKISDAYGEIESGYRLGTGLSYTLNNIKIGLNGGYINRGVYYLGIGGEIQIFDEIQIVDSVYLRTGYIYRNDNIEWVDGIKGGIGIKKRALELNYGVEYKPYLGIINVIDIVYKM